VRNRWGKREGPRTVTVAIVDQSEPLRIGAVFGRAFRALGGNLLVIFPLTLIIVGIPDFLTSYMLNDYRRGLMMTGGNTAGISLLLLLIGSILQTLASGALLMPVMRDREGGKAGFIESMHAFMVRAPRLICVALLYAIGTIIGLILLLVPYVFLAISWAVVAPVAAGETFGANAAFGRSKALVQGDRMRILGIGLVTLTIMGLIGFAALIVEAFIFRETSLDLSRTPAVLAVSAIGTTISSAFGAAVQCALYLELRARKDGPSGQLGAIFA
jgi:hypothetical protein